MNFLWVLGFLDRGCLFRRLQNRLEVAGRKCFAPTLSPRDARRGISDLANKLADLADQNLPADASLALVGFGMGCLVAKYYLQSEGGSRRVCA
jgi:triacylglycerol lipase